jgi:hypothetical protein
MARIINAIFWFGVWLAIAINFNALGDPPRLLGEAVIPALLWFAIDSWLRRRKSRASPERSV